MDVQQTMGFILSERAASQARWKKIDAMIAHQNAHPVDFDRCLAQVAKSLAEFKRTLRQLRNDAAE